MKSCKQVAFVVAVALLALVANASAQSRGENATCNAIALGSAPASEIAADTDNSVKNDATAAVLPPSIVLGAVYRDESAPYLRLDESSPAAFWSGANGSGFVLASNQQAITNAQSLPWMKGN